jgi:hypothetical protein
MDEEEVEASTGTLHLIEEKVRRRTYDELNVESEESAMDKAFL